MKRVTVTDTSAAVHGVIKITIGAIADCMDAFIQCFETHCVHVELLLAGNETAEALRVSREQTNNQLLNLTPVTNAEPDNFAFQFIQLICDTIRVFQWINRVDQITDGRNGATAFVNGVLDSVEMAIRNIALGDSEIHDISNTWKDAFYTVIFELDQFVERNFN